MRACARKPEAQLVVALIRPVPIAIGNTQVPGVVVPAAAAIDAVRAVLGCYPF